MMPTKKTFFKTIRGLFFPIAIAFSLLSPGCSSPETRITKLLAQAQEKADEGDLEAAILLLEEGGQKYPESAGILELKAQFYEQVPDYVMAAMTYDRLSGFGPEYRDRALDAARQFATAGEMDSAIRSLEAYLQNQPENSEGWILKGRYLSRMQRREDAASAYLRAVRLMNGQIDGVLGVEVGDTFLALDQYVQAERFYRDAYDANDVARVDAMLGLLAVAYQQKQWAEASDWLEKVDAIDPGIVNNSYLADVRPELARWRSNRVDSADVAIDLNGSSESDGGDGEDGAVTVVIDVGPAPEGVNSEGFGGEGGVPVVGAGVDGIPGTETEVDPTTGGGTGGKLAVEDGVGGEDEDGGLNPEAMAVAGGSGIVDSSTEALDAVPGGGAGGKLAAAGIDGDDTGSSGENPTEEVVSDPIEIVDVEPTAFDLAIDLANAGRHDEAIREYWKILADGVDQPDVWNRLSRSYRANRAWSDAEATALEAMRREPRNIVYTFDYLKAVENSRSPERFLEELERAYTRIPNSPDLVLALARAYVDIDGNARNAAVYYRLFLEMAPTHPEAFSAEQELAVLRVR